MPTLCDCETSLSSVLASFQKALECPICLHTLRIPFKVCLKGHAVCCECASAIEKCPSCQEVFLFENLPCVKNLLEILPRVCRYSSEGCGEILEFGSDHEIFCVYRPIVCREQKCPVEVPVVRILEHYKTHHDRYAFKDALDNRNFWKTFDPNSKAIVYTPIFIFNNLFWTVLVNDVDNEQLKIYFEATPMGRLENDYYIRIKFEKEEFMFTYTMKASVVNDCRVKLQVLEDGSDDGVKVQNGRPCMSIPHTELDRFMDEEGEMAYNIFFFKKNKDSK